MPDIVEQMKTLLGMGPSAPPPEPTPSPSPQPADIIAPAPEPVAPVPPAPAPAPPPVTPPPAPAPVGPTSEDYVKLQEAIALLASRPSDRTAEPAAPKMPGLLDQKGLEAALRKQFGDAASPNDLSFSWNNMEPLAVPEAIPRMSD